MNLPEDVLTIGTPENVAFGYPIAGIGSRFIAALVDTLAIAALQALVFSFTALFVGSLGELTAETLSAWAVAALGLVAFLFFWGYYIFFEMLWNGQSPGKRLTGLRVVRTDGTPITLTESLVRNLIRVVDFLPTLYGLGVVVMFVDSRSRRLGDLAAGTLVVRESGEPIHLETLAAGRSARVSTQPWLEGAGYLPVEKLSRADLDLLDAYLQRRNQIADPGVLEEHILGRLFARMELPVPNLDRREADRLLVEIRLACDPQTPHRDP